MRRTHSNRSSRSFVFVILISALAITAGWRALSASAVDAEDLRGEIPTGNELRDQLDELAELRVATLGELTAAETKLAQVFIDRDNLSSRQRALTAEIEAATENLRSVAVQTYVTGGTIGNLQFLADVGEASELAWRQHLVRNHAGSSQVAVSRLRNLRDRADDDVVDTIDLAERLRSDITHLEITLTGIKPLQTEAERLLPFADAWDRAAIAIAEGPYGIAPAEKWAALRRCESTDNYSAISPSGVYRGAYQFDIPTWYTVGGSGDPALAPAEEQDARARELYARRGDAPWPICGRHLQ